jgi:hypothetical protein
VFSINTDWAAALVPPTVRVPKSRLVGVTLIEIGVEVDAGVTVLVGVSLGVAVGVSVGTGVAVAV